MRNSAQRDGRIAIRALASMRPRRASSLRLSFYVRTQLPCAGVSMQCLLAQLHAREVLSSLVALRGQH
jgi:hypothetical protein